MPTSGKSHTGKRTMSGEKDLKRLLAAMKPELSDEEYLFCHFPHDSKEVPVRDSFAIIREKEAITAILRTDHPAARTISGETTFKRITLNVHSSLEAVGLSAAVTSALAAEGISANVIAGFYHDHLFVPAGKSQRALLILENL